MHLRCCAVDKARLAGIAAAAAAASHVTPAQREKAVADAAAAVSLLTAHPACEGMILTLNEILQITLHPSTMP